MPNRSRRREEIDPAVLAFRIVQHTTGGGMSRRKRKNPAAVSLGRLGGLKGGKARAAALSPRRRSEIAREAARRRWSKKQPEGQS